MKKALMIGGGAWLAAACVLAIVASPTSVIRQISGVYLVWFISNVINWIGLGVMAGACALSVPAVASRDVHLRHAIWLGMQKRSFWIAFWVSGAALVVNTLAPVALFFYVPVWLAAAAVALNLFLNAGSPAFRIWIWRIHSQNEVSV